MRRYRLTGDVEMSNLSYLMKIPCYIFKCQNIRSTEFAQPIQSPIILIPPRRARAARICGAGPAHIQDTAPVWQVSSPSYARSIDTHIRALEQIDMLHKYTQTGES